LINKKKRKQQKEKVSSSEEWYILLDFCCYRFFQLYRVSKILAKERIFREPRENRREEAVFGGTRNDDR
jgi:hypothetical protein